MVRRVNMQVAPSAKARGSLRVLHLCAGNLYGGIETVLRILAEERATNPTMEPAFALTAEGRLSRELQASGAALHMLPAVRVRHPWTVLRARRALRRLLGTERYDVAVCHSTWLLGVFGSTLRAAGLPFVYFQHDVARGTHWIERWAKRKVPDGIVSNSHFTAKSAAHLFPGKLPVVVHCPVRAPLQPAEREDVRSAVRRELDADDDTVVILQVSRLDRGKGHELFLRALSNVRSKKPWAVWIVGGIQRETDSTYLDALRSLADEKGIAPRVRWLGQRSDVSSLMTAADVSCQPNLEPEGFGIVYIEAMGHGLPVVTTSLGAATEIVSSDCGVLVPPHEDQLASALTNLIDNVDARRALGANGPARARDVSDVKQQMSRLGNVLAALARGDRDYSTVIS
ncbi:glycosyltransferase family 4 protein [Pendulispora rubella]|uniref:Glycosyltransferase family 4 protein n=1 Tax=Pendulispora rubella TaxID=2741070 RepID=A0ABZ2LBR8_9BACT